MPTRVFLVDDHTVLRAGLRMLLEEEPDISIVGEAEDAESALAHVSAAAPQVIVLDITLPGITGIDAIAGLVERCPNAAIVLLTMHENTFLVKQAMQRGARGFVLKSSADREIVAAIREVTAGRVYLDSTRDQVCLRAVARGLAIRRRRRQADRPREAGRRVCRARVFQQGDRRGAVHRREDRREPSAQNHGPSGTPLAGGTGALRNPGAHPGRGA